jgi:DNA-binding NtrC family response regulator
MALVSVSQAARLAGISRQHLYRKYIKPGEISVQRDGKGDPVIDTSELLRVFGRLVGDNPGGDNGLQEETLEKTIGDNGLLAELQARLQVLEVENRLLRERLEDKDRNLEDMRQALRLLEDMRPKEVPRLKEKPWWKRIW